jgi:hypothetical protein
MALFNSPVLEVAIGLIFVYLLLSILCTAANEWVAALTRRRGEMLRRSIQQLLENQRTSAEGHDDDFIELFYAHPLISSMMKDKNHPTYIAPRTFAAVVTDNLTPQKPGAIEFDDLETGCQELPPGSVKKGVLALLQRSGRDLGVAQTAIEGWFNDAMDRVSGWYKRRTQVWTLIIAAAMTLAANADTTYMAQRLWTDPVLRSEMIEQAKARTEKPAPTISVDYEDEDDPTKSTVTRTEAPAITPQENQALQQLLGWHGQLRGKNWKEWSERLLGWLLTVLAISMGAPFWFDLLNKFMNVRFAGKSPDETSKKPEKLDEPVRA